MNSQINLRSGKNSFMFSYFNLHLSSLIYLSLLHCHFCNLPPGNHWQSHSSEIPHQENIYLGRTRGRGPSEDRGTDVIIRPRPLTDSQSSGLIERLL